MLKAFVLCAGLGTRLRPLTFMMPKALLPIWGRPAIFHVFDHLKTIGVKEIIINIHHLPNKFKTMLGDRVRYSYEEKLFDTGGGLKKVEYFLKDNTFIMYNCDVITNVNLKRMLGFHKKNKNYVTLLASKEHKPKHLVVNKMGRVISIKGKGNYAFCGVHIIEPFIFDFIPKGESISIIDIYNRLIEEGIPIHVFPLGKAFWQEVGDMKSYMEINNYAANI